MSHHCVLCRDADSIGPIFGHQSPGSGLDPDPYWIRIRNDIQSKMLDSDLDEINADPQSLRIKCSYKDRGTQYIREMNTVINEGYDRKV